MLDGILAVIGQIRKPKFDINYTADQAIVKATLIECPGSSKLIVVFLPWHSPAWFERHLTRILSQTRFNVLLYAFSPSIIASDVLTVKNSFEYIALSVSSDIERLEAEKKYTHITLFGISLGSVALCLAAEKIKHFNNVIMVVPGDYLADALWNGWRTHSLRNQYKKLGYSLKELEKAWYILAPASHVEVFRGHTVDIILAEKDRWIPNKYGRNLVNALRSSCTKVTFSEKPFGHVLTILTFTPRN